MTIAREAQSRSRSGEQHATVITQRWQEATGEAAVLAGEDRVFADVATTRGGDHDVIDAA